MRVKGVLESCLYVSDLAAAQEFYGRVLGLEVHSRHAGRHLFFRCGDGMFLLFDPRTSSLPSGIVPTHGAFGPGHVAFSIDQADLRAWKEHLQHRGVAIEAEVIRSNGGQSL